VRFLASFRVEWTTQAATDVLTEAKASDAFANDDEKVGNTRRRMSSDPQGACKSSTTSRPRNAKVTLADISPHDEIYIEIRRDSNPRGSNPRSLKALGPNHTATLVCTIGTGWFSITCHHIQSKLD